MPAKLTNVVREVNDTAETFGVKFKTVNPNATEEQLGAAIEKAFPTEGEIISAQPFYKSPMFVRASSVLLGVLGLGASAYGGYRYGRKIERNGNMNALATTQATDNIESATPVANVTPMTTVPSRRAA